MRTPHTCEFFPRPFSCVPCRRQARNVLWSGVGLAAAAGISWLAAQAAAATLDAGRALSVELKAKDTEVDKAQDDAIEALAGKVDTALPEAKADELIRLLVDEAAERRKRARPRTGG